MASIRKRSWVTPAGEQKSAWLVAYKDVAGKRRFKQFDRKKDAEAWRTKTAWDVVQGVHTPDSQSITVAQAADKWLAKCINEGREVTTTDAYDQLIRLHIVPYLGDMKLSKLTMPMVEAYKNALLETRSPAMANKALNALSMLITSAQRAGAVAQNVARGVRVTGRDRTGKVVIPTKGELRDLLRLVEPSFQALLLTVIFTGLRASEFRGLCWAQVDLKESTITVCQRADKFNVIGPPKSTAGYRTIPVPEVVIQALKVWKLKCPNGPLNLVFPNSGGGVWAHNNLLRRWFIPLQVSAGIVEPWLDDGGQQRIDGDGNLLMAGRYAFHALRHAAASAWIKQKVDLKRLTVWLGHASVQQTIDTYGHLIADAEGDAAITEAAQRELLG